jgi:hypothetical protein
MARNNLMDIKAQEAFRQLARRQGSDNDPLIFVDWNAPSIRSLLNAVDPALPHPKAIGAQARAEPTRTPWVDTDCLMKILKSGRKKVAEDKKTAAAEIAAVSARLNVDDGNAMEM